MNLLMGADFFSAKAGKIKPIAFNIMDLINPHMLLLGGSGSGKSFTIRRFVEQAQYQSTHTRFLVFDVHGDMHIPGESVVRFSEASEFGLNPLRVDPDPEAGGVRTAIQRFLDVLESSTRALGENQEGVLRNLLLDVYKNFGFDPKDASTWSLEGSMTGGGNRNRVYLDVPFKEKDKARALGASWDTKLNGWYVQAEDYKGELLQWPVVVKKRSYPTINDVYLYAKSLLEERVMGTDQKALRALQLVNKHAQTLRRKQIQYLKMKRTMTGFVDEELEASLEAAKVKAIELYTDYVNAVSTGTELESLQAFDSVDTLKSVVNRLENLAYKGVFKGGEPPFDPSCRIWRYDLSKLKSAEQKMFVMCALQDTFDSAKSGGHVSHLNVVAVVDELGLYTAGMSLAKDNIFTQIAKEARKFGMAMWSAAQSTDDVPKKLIASLAVKIILGIDELYWKNALANLMIDAKLMQFVFPKKKMAVQFKSSFQNKWHWVDIPDKSSDFWDLDKLKNLEV